MRLELTDTGALLATFHVRPILIDRIRELQTQDPTVIKLKKEAESGQLKGFLIRADGTLMMGHNGKMCCTNTLPMVETWPKTEGLELPKQRK